MRWEEEEGKCESTEEKVSKDLVIRGELVGDDRDRRDEAT